MKSLNDVLMVAENELGNTEYPPKSNKTKYGEAYGLNGYYWCMIFLWWVFREAGQSSAFFGGAKTASCGTYLRWCKEQGMLVPFKDIQPGDIVILNFSGTQDTEHCGLVTYVVNEEWVQTIEGNTSPGSEGSQDNGGCVAKKLRNRKNVIAVCRPMYSEDKIPDYIGHWAENDIRWAIDQGIMKGYDDGDFRPDKFLTRAEFVTVLRRIFDKNGGLE